MALKVRFLGVRGSLPAPHDPREIELRIRDSLEDFFDSGFNSRVDIDTYLSALPIERYGGFGGNTPCLEVYTESTSLLIDGGSGICKKGYELMQGPCGKGKGEIHLLMTHFHWDHVIGLPFFVPLFIPTNKIHIYSVQPEAEENISILFRKPNFPVSYGHLGAEFEYHVLEPRKPVSIGDIVFTPYELDHPDSCWGYKIESQGRVLSHCVDTECKRSSREELGPDLPLYQNINLMIFDAQYTLSQAIEKINWGHAAATIGLDIAMSENVDRIIFMHHDPAASDEKIARAARQAKQYEEYSIQQSKQADVPLRRVNWSFAQEGMVVTV
jgi:phosphoribosyl 1,2-cyclic phosphodiesterase